MDKIINLSNKKAFTQWLSTNKQQLAERWLRYQQQFAPSSKIKEQQINYLAVEFLEASLEHEPTQQQITAAERMVKKNLNPYPLFSIQCENYYAIS